MKRIITIFILSLFVTFSFCEDIVISRTQLSNLLDSVKNLEAWTPNELYRYYENNQIKFEKDFNHVAFKVGGRISTIRRGFFDEYIVELKCTDNWVSDLAVVYPKQISDAMKNDLANLQIGQYFEALVVGRKSWYYVDVPVWNSNGVYRTQP